MRYQLPSLPALHAFEAAARHESFAAAAQELNLSQAAVSHRVRQLEAVLGYKLFLRKPRSLELTEMGKAYLPSIRKTFDDLSISTAGLFGAIGSKALSLTIRAPISFATLWLAPRLDQFCAAYPSMDVRLKTSVWSEGLHEDEVDVEIRNGHGQWPGYNAEQIINDVAVPVCSPATLAALGPIKHIEDFKDLDLVHILSLEDLWLRLIRSDGTHDNIAMEGIIVDSTVAALELASAGTRFAIAPRSFIQSYLETNRLVIALDTHTKMESSNYLLTRVDQNPTKPETMLFREWLLTIAHVV